MVRLSCLPKPVANWLHVLQPMFRHRHHLVFCWLLVCQAVYQEKATLTGLARLAPCHIAEWHLRRFLTAAYWNWRVLLWRFADQAIAALPPPDDGVCYLVVDSTLKGKTGQQHPLAKKGRLNEYAPYIFGLHMVIVMLHWGNYRIPVDFEIIRRKEDPRYRLENRLFRWMLVRFRRPAWAKAVVVVADAAFASKGNVKLIQRRGYFFVIAFARTWRFENGRTMKDLGHPFAQASLSSLLGAPGRTRPPSDLLDLYQTGVPPSYRRCHHHFEQEAAHRWAESDKDLGDQSA